MKNYRDKVLKACVKQARKGKRDINVFDLMYETSLAYPQLKAIIDRLVSKNELEIIDIKTYRFTGDTDWISDDEQTQESIFENAEYASGRDTAFAARRAYLEERRKEIIARMQEEEEQRNDELDREFEEYAKFLQGGSDEADERKSGDICGQTEKLAEFLNALICGERADKPRGDFAGHPSWEDEEGFLQACAEKLMEIVNCDKRTGRQGALKKAKILLEEMQKIKDEKMTEVYSCIVFGLHKMSNYYYIKIREGLL